MFTNLSGHQDTECQASGISETPWPRVPFSHGNSSGVLPILAFSLLPQVSQQDGEDFTGMGREALTSGLSSGLWRGVDLCDSQRVTNWA